MRIRWRGLELPNRVISDRSTLTDTYGKFSVEPFERGFGTTVGNSLRRILLSSLEGSAVTRVKIQGVQHEITTIPGVVEDVTDIILNIKSLVVKYEIEETRVGQRTNYDKLVMEIWTNGTVTPQMAVVEGAKIMRKHLNPFIQYAEPGPEIAIDEVPQPTVVDASVDSEMERKLNMS